MRNENEKFKAKKQTKNKQKPCLSLLVKVTLLSLSAVFVGHT